MSFKTTLTLLIVLAAIVVGLWLAAPSKETAEAPPPETPPESDTEYVFDPQIDAESVRRIELERPDAPRLVFEHVAAENGASGPAAWRMVEPVAAGVEAFAVRGLITTVSGLQSRAQFEPGSEGEPTVAEAGFEPPTATIKLTDEAGTEYALEIGKSVVMSNDTYVRIAGETMVRVATRDLLPQVRKKADEYRSKRLIDLKLNDAVALRVEHAGVSYAFSRGQDDEWVIEEPLRAQAVRDKVRSLITSFSTARAEEFVDNAPADLARYGLAEPFLTFSVTTETKRELPADEAAETQPAEPQYETLSETHTLLVGTFAGLKTERRYVKPASEPWVATVQDTNITGLIPNLKELRDPHVTRVKATDISTLDITTGGMTATLKKVDGVWRGTGDLAEVETAAITDVLDAFEDLQAIDYIDMPEAPAVYGLDQPRAILKVTTAGAVAPITLSIGNDTASGRNCYVRRGDESAVIVTRAVQAARLAVDILALRSREIFTFPVDQLQHISVERPALHYELAREDSRWKLVEPADAPIDPGSARALANDLARLRAKNVAGKGDDARFGLDQPATTMTIRFTVAEPEASTQPTVAAPVMTEHTLRVGRKDNVAYARVDDEPYVFELDETVYRVMIAELINTQLFHFKPDDVTAIKIVGTGGTLELVRDGDKWKYAPDPFVELLQEKVKGLINDIAQMRAEAYFAYNDGDLEAEGLLEPPATLTISLADGGEVVLNMTPEWPGELPRKAALAGARTIFRMRLADCEKLFHGLSEYVKPEQPAEQPPEQPAPRRAPRTGP